MVKLFSLESLFEKRPFYTSGIYTGIKVEPNTLIKSTGSLDKLLKSDLRSIYYHYEQGHKPWPSYRSTGNLLRLSSQMSVCR